MVLRAFAVDGSCVMFTLDDCPVQITESTCALSGRPNSKIIQSQTIMRGDETSMIFEGDKVYEEDSLVGYVIYDCGFKIQNLEGELKDLHLNSHIQVRGGDKESSKLIYASLNRTPLFLKCGEHIIQYYVFLCKRSDGLLAVSGKSYPQGAIHAEELQHFTGLVRNGRQLFFGDEYDGGQIILYDGQPMLFKDGEIQCIKEDI